MIDGECLPRADQPQADRRAYRFRISRITRRMSTIAIRLKQIDEMLQPTPGSDDAATLRPSAPIAIASDGTHRGTRDRSRLDANHRRAAPTSSVADRASG